MMQHIPTGGRGDVLVCGPSPPLPGKDYSGGNTAKPQRDESTLHVLRTFICSRYFLFQMNAESMTGPTTGHRYFVCRVTGELRSLLPSTRR